MFRADPAILRAPHRPFFLLGTTALILALAAWLLQLAWPRPLPAPPGWLHGWLMAFGALGPFISGFLFTAYSRWLGAPPPGPACWRSSLVLQVLGLVALALGAAAPGPWTVLAALALGAGWSLVLGHLLSALRNGQGAALHAGAMTGAVALGVIALGLLLGWGVSGHGAWAGASLAVTQWGFLLGVYLVVTHRMLPFFAGCVLDPYRPYRPAWALLLALGLALAHLALVLLRQPEWLWLADGPLCVLTAWLAWKWQVWRARSRRLLAALFVAWAGLFVGTAALTAQSLSYHLTGAWLGGRGPDHLVTIGFFGAMVLAMATRVTLGHSGRKLEMGALAWWALWGVIAAAAGRGLAEVLPGRAHWLVLSAVLWLLAAGAWAVRYAPMLWRPRVDGKPG